jgi:hypothetical protein
MTRLSMAKKTGKTGPVGGGNWVWNRQVKRPRKSANILQYDAATGTPLGSGPLVAAGSGGLNAPAGLTVGRDGNLYVSNGYDSSVLKFDVQGNFLGAFVSSGACGLQSPTSLTFESDGNLYIAGFSTSSVLVNSGTTGSFLQTFVPTGAGRDC